ncbi:MAG TPA: hypothetical protein VFW83_03605 [Bryobacteraceae bacterium]|nr:hypothetical protein [Bryobacteraceae bacterium]
MLNLRADRLIGAVDVPAADLAIGRSFGKLPYTWIEAGVRIRPGAATARERFPTRSGQAESG